MSRENRFLPGVRAEVRTVGSKRMFVGRAVQYGEWSELLYGTFRERILPGAFDESLKSGTDVYADVDHDASRVLGRLSAGTLRLLPDEQGIGVEVDAGEYSYAKDLAVGISRGDLRGMSFVFDVTDDKWESRDGVPHRTVTKADLYEVAFVFFPAYPASEAGMRSAVKSFLSFDLERRRRRLRLAEVEV